jgi:hypothetical protein
MAARKLQSTPATKDALATEFALGLGTKSLFVEQHANAAKPSQSKGSSTAQSGDRRYFKQGKMPLRLIATHFVAQNFQAKQETSSDQQGPCSMDNRTHLALFFRGYWRASIKDA